MARRTEVVEHLIDDLDGGKAEESVTFSYQGVSYQLDLNKKNAKTFHADMSKWAEAGRKVRKPVAAKRRVTTAQTQPSGVSAQIRAWAAEQGVEVPARGRISSAIHDQWAAATQ